MRTTIATVAILGAGLIGLALSGTAAASVMPLSVHSPSVPGAQTCLIINGGQQGVFTKAMVCAQAHQQNGGSVASGSYLAPSSSAHVVATVTLQANLNPAHPDVFTTVATTTSTGVGRVTTTTTPRHIPAGAKMRACVAAGAKGATSTAHLCTGAQ